MHSVPKLGASGRRFVRNSWQRAHTPGAFHPAAGFTLVAQKLASIVPSKFLN